ncbi:hypothetical protein CBR_g54114 [Chara braunii]|uniref:Integrase catalytic domain-containing protein n=1 Tax=Chara braunii TaxID=69332 RepID=A0A388MC34_CHABU|nr:hypothetical protein CBR_g54114 [Chara braunii]|eukprot:GBG92019.1 hypothetical protein CBR_g54114 [Chara braunii]
MCGYYRNFVKNYSTVASPLIDLTRLDTPWDWSDECEAAFKRLKHAFMNHEVLMVPDPQKPFIVTTDASQYGIGAVLAQQDGKKLRPIEYMSKKMPSKKLAKSTYERELYALYKALVHWRHFLLGRFFYLRTDHQTLKWIKTQPTLSDALKRWIEVIDQYDFKLEYLKGEYNKVADALSRRADYLGALVYEFGVSEKVTQSLVGAYQEDPVAMDIIRKLQAKDKATEDEFVMVDGLLFLDKVGCKRLVIPSSERLRSLFLGECHDTTGHFGYKKTNANLVQRFWWPGMLEDAKKYVETCQVCQRDKPRTQASLGLLKPLPIPAGPGQSVSMDFMDTLVTSKSGKRHIFVIIDRFTKYARLIAMPETARTDHVIKLFMDNWVRDFGLPKSIVSDRHVRFTSELWKKTAEQMGSQLQMTSGNHPEANGQAEQMNRVVQHLLRHYIKPDQDDWVEKLPLIASLYNNAVHSSTGVSPNQLHLGWKPRSALDFLLPENRPSATPGTLEYGVKYDKLLQQAVEHIKKSQQAMIASVNRHRRQSSFQFAEPMLHNLESCIADSTPALPLLFILSPGCEDPTMDLIRFADEQGIHVEGVSLGQGQGPVAEKAILEAAETGSWVLLQNCHLVVNWLPKLELLFDSLKSNYASKDLTPIPGPVTVPASGQTHHQSTSGTQWSSDRLGKDSSAEGKPPSDPAIAAVNNKVVNTEVNSPSQYGLVRGSKGERGGGGGEKEEDDPEEEDDSGNNEEEEEGDDDDNDDHNDGDDDEDEAEEEGQASGKISRLQRKQSYNATGNTVHRGSIESANNHGTPELKSGGPEVVESGKPERLSAASTSPFDLATGPSPSPLMGVENAGGSVETGVWSPIPNQTGKRGVRISPQLLHPSFRLWLTSYPSAEFPSTLVESAVKMTTEAPKGLRANLLRSFTSHPICDEEFFQCTDVSGNVRAVAGGRPAWKRMILGLCFFHAFVQERRRFGPLGWNVPYDFSDGDLRVSARQLKILVENHAASDMIPYKALRYCIGECNYGGRVTDDHDRKTLMTLMALFYCPAIHKETFQLPDGDYLTLPDDEAGYEEYLQYIRGAGGKNEEIGGGDGEKKLEWKLRMKREKKRRREEVYRLTTEVENVRACRQEVQAQADVSAKMDKMLGYLEVLSEAWLEERQANWGHDVALNAMRSGFREFARDMVTRVGAEVRRLRDNVGKFCEGTIEGAKAVATVESEARPRKDPVKLKFPSYGGKPEEN